MYCARSNALGSAVFARLSRPAHLIETLRIRSDSIQRASPSRIDAKYARPVAQNGRHHLHRVGTGQNRLDAVDRVSPRRRSRRASRRTRPCRIASQRRRSSSSSLSTARTRGQTARCRMSMSGWREPIEQHEPVGAGVVEFAGPRWPNAVKNGDSFTATGILSSRLRSCTICVRPCSIAGAD